MGLTNNSSPPTKRWLRFRFRSHPCLRHGQAPLRSLVIRSGVASKKKEKFPKNGVFLNFSYITQHLESEIYARHGGPDKMKKKYSTFMTTTLLLCTLVPNLYI